VTTSSESRRLVPAVHGRRGVEPDPPFELGLSEYLRTQFSREQLLALMTRHSGTDDPLELLLRRALWRAVTRRFGNAVRIGRDVLTRHPETFEIGDGVFIGDQANLQGRIDGTCIIGNHVWIGPQAFLDARDLVIEDDVGWGPAARVLGSVHTGVPVNVPIIQTDLEIKRVVIGRGADIGMNSTIMPGVNVGEGAIIGAASVVTQSVPPYAVMAGVPARFVRWREGYEPATRATE
jgi:acetyltransferase-like isoleucine patch superfamily enzyme